MQVVDPDVQPVGVPEPVTDHVPTLYPLEGVAVNTVEVWVLSVQVPPLLVHALTVDPPLPLTDPFVGPVTVRTGLAPNVTVTVVSEPE